MSRPNLLCRARASARPVNQSAGIEGRGGPVTPFLLWER